MRIYISGPITGVEPRLCAKQFNDAARRLKKNGHTVVNPIELDRKHGALGSWADFMKRDIKLLVDCEAIRLLDGWENSTGARLEQQLADALGITRVDADGYTLPKMADMVGPTPSILLEADRLVHGPRQASYGRPLGDFTRTGKLWGALLQIGRDVTPQEVGICMAALKLSREVNKHKSDNLVDCCGYAATVQMVNEDLGVPRD